MKGPALIPAAGHSVRMGRPKLLLPFAARTIVEGLIAAALDGGVERVVVVVRPDDAELADVSRQAGAEVVRLEADTSEMRATVLAGLDWIEHHIPASQRPGFYLIPADHPVLVPEVFHEIASAVGTIVAPTFQGRRGHPVWIAWPHVAALRVLPAGQGLNVYLRTQSVVEFPWPTADVLRDLDTPADYEELLRTGPTLIDAAGQRQCHTTQRPQSLLPGSFNPIHAGHWGLAATAREILGQEVAFELSRRNVDKPDLTDAEIDRRAAQFVGRADLWITEAPRFAEKARLFPGAIFVVGADTAARVVDLRYHKGDEERLAAALDGLRRGGCRFLVAARTDAAGTILTLDELAVPPRWKMLFEAIPASRFRLDISSSQLRRGEVSA